jgi:tetratricopeptide (TPR) repeat protein
VTIGTNWFGSIRREELGLASAVAVELVYDAPLPGGKPVPPADDPYLRLTAEERQKKGTELVIEAGASFRKANYGRAATLFDEARKVAPTAEVYYYLGICYQQMKEPDRAVALLREGTGKFPQDPLLWKSLGVLLTEQEKPDEARKALDEALRLSPEDRQARFLRDRLGEKKER